MAIRREAELLGEWELAIAAILGESRMSGTDINADTTAFEEVLKDAIHGNYWGVERLTESEFLRKAGFAGWRTWAKKYQGSGRLALCGAVSAEDAFVPRDGSQCNVWD
ncbi:MAG: hypothetical protein ACLTKE_14620 [Coprococcus sp.]